MPRHWVLNCDIHNEKHGFVAENNVTVMLFFQKSKLADTPEVFLAEVKRHLPDDVRTGLARADARKGRLGYRLRFIYDAFEGNVYIQPRRSSPKVFVATVPEQYR
jgi:hypothetical protein